MSGLPASAFILSPDEMPVPEIDTAEATKLLRLAGIEADRWPQIVATLNDGAQDYVLSRMAEFRGATRTDVAEYKARLFATLDALAALLETRGPSADSAAVAILQRAISTDAIPSDYPGALLSAFRDFARRIAPTVQIVGSAPRGREEQAMRHERFARRFLQACRSLGLPVKTTEKSLVVSLFVITLNSVFEPLAAGSAARLLRRTARAMRDD